MLHKYRVVFSLGYSACFSISLEDSQLEAGAFVPRFRVLLLLGKCKMQIPTSFTKFFNGITPCKATLVDHDGKSWDVNLENIDGGLVFENGWEKFAKERDLEDGDFLVFQYDGIFTFSVKVFSKTGCRKVAAPPSGGQILTTVKLEQDYEQTSGQVQNGVKRKHSSLSPEINQKSVLGGACSSEGTRQHKLRKVKEEKDDYSEMNVAVPKSELPRRVVKEMKIKLNRKISLRDENDRVWPASIHSTGKKDRHFLGGGWYDFKRSQNIEEGCKCDFEFVVDKANVARELLVRVRSDSYW
ncbi:unnamed protein product [Sphenostylis stenocarpa]|uniref:TF-B3 domain-containing protein n=1 Tax=Sphenostylis stenocarpa TaxID=92480 RepID=A0AA86VZW9_9FABA|nr:unnamed protein product [Sphenostylis stenocarpa]